MTCWLGRALPVYPFSLWPLGYWSFLGPLLRDNPYRAAVSVVELMDEAAFVETCRRLLFDGCARDLAIGRQHAYAEKVRGLPSAAQLIDTYLQ
jgi:hypothetical protein